MLSRLAGEPPVSYQCQLYILSDAPISGPGHSCSHGTVFCFLSSLVITFFYSPLAWVAFHSLIDIAEQLHCVSTHCNTFFQELASITTNEPLQRTRLTTWTIILTRTSTNNSVFTHSTQSHHASPPAPNPLPSPRDERPDLQPF